MKVVWIIAGVPMIFTSLHDVFHTLFHPAGRGAMSDWVAQFTWKLFLKTARGRQQHITLAGPFAILSIMMLWVGLVVLGFACIYMPFLQTQFALAPGIDSAQHHTFVDAINVSIGALITIGGDFNAKSHLIRLAMGAEAILGFGLLTASVSWLLSIYPVLERQRTTAHEATLLHHAEDVLGTRVTELPQSEGHQIIWGLAAQVSSLRNDLTQFPITYYFQAGDQFTGFAGVLPYLYELAEEASRPNHPTPVRMAGIALGGAVADYLDYVAETFLRMKKNDKQAILKSIGEQHARPPVHFARPLPHRNAS